MANKSRQGVHMRTTLTQDEQQEFDEWLDSLCDGAEDITESGAELLLDDLRKSKQVDMDT